MFVRRKLRGTRFLGVAAVTLGLTIPMAFAQDRDRDRDRDWDRDHVTRIEPGTRIPVRTNDTIDVDHRDDRVYYGIVDQDVRGENGRLAIPRGARVEMLVRVAPDNDLVLDLDSVIIDGRRYRVDADARVESRRDNSIVGAIVGAVEGGQVRGRTVRVPRDSVLTFRIDRPMVMGADRGGY